MVGKSYAFKFGTKNAGFYREGDKLVAKFCAGDVLKCSGIVDGGKFTGCAVPLMACGKSKGGGRKTYKLVAPIVMTQNKYGRLLTFRVTIDGKRRVCKVTKAFAKILD